MLETPQGGIWESNAIARYLARLSDSGLFGSTPIETVRIFFPAVAVWRLFGRMPTASLVALLRVCSSCNQLIGRR